MLDMLPYTLSQVQRKAEIQAIKENIIETKLTPNKIL